MHVVMGATGHVGSAVASELLARGEPVTVVVHGDHLSNDWEAKGARVVKADVDDVKSLKRVLASGERAFVLNPPANTKTDTDATERHSVVNILAALKGLSLTKIVAASTAGAQAGERIGDLSVLWQLEEGLRGQPIPAAINRAAYYMSNWDNLLEVVQSSFVLPTLFPADLELPMVAPQDLGKAAAARMMSDVADVGVQYIEGPKRYSTNDVAQAFGRALGHPIKVVETPRSEWHQAYLKLGFSEAAADAYARMTAVSIDQGFDAAANPIRGTTDLDTYIDNLIKRSAK